MLIAKHKKETEAQYCQTHKNLETQTQTSPISIASYDLRLGNGAGLFYSPLPPPHWATSLANL